MDERYKIIEPKINDKIYVGYNLKLCSKKCWADLKAKMIPNLKQFRIMNIDNGKEYTFQIHQPHIMANKPIIQSALKLQTFQMGGGVDDIQPTIPDANDGTVANDVNNATYQMLNDIDTRLKSLTDRMDKVEMMVPRQVVVPQQQYTLPQQLNSNDVYISNARRLDTHRMLMKTEGLHEKKDDCTIC